MSYGASSPTDKTLYPPGFLTKDGKLKPGISAKQIEATEECRAIAALSKMGITVVVSAGNRAQPMAIRPYCWCAAALAVAWITDLDGLPGGLAGGPAPVWGDSPILWGVDDTPYANSGYAVGGTLGAKRMIGAPGGELYCSLQSCFYQPPRQPWIYFYWSPNQMALLASRPRPVPLRWHRSNQRPHGWRGVGPVCRQFSGSATCNRRGRALLPHPQVQKPHGIINVSHPGDDEAVQWD